ncbi:MAG: putative manganese transporter [Prevotellaceae bacterium]|jgi:hypothetical protein|nr:putative manganese transporter [Prevotellaceae bacterium]
MLEEIADILRNTALITCLVMTMLLLIEYINVTTRTSGLDRLRKSKFGQVLVATLLGVIPGCLGGFASVSLFTHGVVNFGALAASMISTMGDEAFVMFASFPLQALLLQGMLVILALVVGYAINLVVKQFPAPFAHHHLAIHAADEHHHEEKVSSRWRDNLKHISFQRALLIGGLGLFIIAALSGTLEHAHEHGRAYSHAHHAKNFLFSERWLNLLFSAVAIAVLIIIIRVNEHFLEQHLWEHVIKKHFTKIFLWTLGALVVIAFINHYIEAQDWVKDNLLYMYLAAILIGLIPASGSHLVFVLMFAHGNIPFSVLLVNTIMQDGHAGIPLLAESKRGFIYMKAIKIVIALIVVSGSLWWGF